MPFKNGMSIIFIVYANTLSKLTWLAIRGSPASLNVESTFFWYYPTVPIFFYSIRLLFKMYPYLKLIETVSLVLSTDPASSCTSIQLYYHLLKFKHCKIKRQESALTHTHIRKLKRLYEHLAIITTSPPACCLRSFFSSLHFFFGSRTKLEKPFSILIFLAPCLLPLAYHTFSSNSYWL